MKKSLFVAGIILLVLLLDQSLKIWIKTTFSYGEERLLFGLPWARLNFVENPGMAFGWKLGGDYGKLALSLFRIVAIGFLIYYMTRLIKNNVGYGLLASFALILAGAMGNIIDSAFYGMIFSESSYHCLDCPAKMFPPEGGYGTFLHGKVVDMLFFPFWKNSTGEVLFFQPVFNIADSAITAGVASILLFQRRYFNSEEATKHAGIANNNTTTPENALSDVVIEKSSENTEGV